jgi:hypothetical protein
LRNALLANLTNRSGVGGSFCLAVGVIFYVLPWMGLELLDIARAVAEFDLPMRVLGLWWGDP